MITDSYHGMLFSLIFEKQFFSVHRQSKDYDQSTRQRSVLKTLGIENRYINGNYNDIHENIDYDKVNTSLNREREVSLEYLKAALE